MQRSEWLELVDALGRTFAEGVDDRDASDEFVADNYGPLKEHGLISAMVPDELGGGGASHSDMAMLLRRLAYYDSSTALALSMHQHLVAFQVFNYRAGRPATVLERVAKEHLVLVSTGARDWLESTGTARRGDGGFMVTGRKPFASGSPVGDLIVTSAPYEDPQEGWQVLHFAVPRAASGVSLEQDWAAHGMRSTGSHTIVFDEVFVPDAAVSARRPRSGLAPLFQVIATVALPLVMGVYVGIAERAAEIALEVGAPRRHDGAVQWAAGEMQSALLVAQAAHERAVALANDWSFEPSPQLANEAFIWKSRIAQETVTVVERAIDVAGGRGYFRRTGLERLRRDVRASDFHPLPMKQQLEFTGRMALGLDPVSGA